MDSPSDGARLSAFNSGKVLFTFPFVAFPSIVEVFTIKTLRGGDS